MAEANVSEMPTGLYWKGKKTEVERISLPFQTIEIINESRATREKEKGTFFKTTPDTTWYNRLVWGDNKYIMASLLEEFAGKINLIYIDPPFATGADFSVKMEIGDVAWEKEPSAIEDKAYRDTWGKGLDSYLQMMYERLVLMRELLVDNGSIYVHLDWHVGHYIKVIMDEIFGKDNFRNEIHCKRVRKNVQEYEAAKRLNVALDLVLFYANSDLHHITQPRSEQKLGERWHAFDAPELRTDMDYELFGVKPPPGRHWMWEESKAREAINQGLLRRNPNSGKPEYKVISENPIVSTLWDDIPAYSFQHDFATEKSEKLLSRILETSTSDRDLVADFFCGAGTAGAVAEKIGRRWIIADLSRYAIHVTRKRLLGIDQCKPFIVQNLGKYERQYWQGITFKKRSNEQIPIYEYIQFVLNLYNAELLSGMMHVHGKKGRRLVHVGAVDAPVTLSEIKEAITEVKKSGQDSLDVLGWEWEMGLHDVVEKEAKTEGVHLRLFSIPRDVMDPRAVEKGDITFYELAYLEVEPAYDKHNNQFFVELKDFAIPNLDMVPPEVRDKIRKWLDYIDYWAVDWDWNQDTFRNMWQSYRTRKDRTLQLKTDGHTYETQGEHLVMVKVIDIFGNDTTRVVEVKS